MTVKDWGIWIQSIESYHKVPLKNKKKKKRKSNYAMLSQNVINIYFQSTLGDSFFLELTRKARI